MARDSTRRGTRGVVREIDAQLERVDRGLAGYEQLVNERRALLAARAALTGERAPDTSARSRTSQDEVAAYLLEHPGSLPAEIAAALRVPVTNVSAHLYRGKQTRFERGEDGWRVRSIEGGAETV
jgi:DNA-directed RNA polymerase specialized sigma24 family protein